MKLEAKKYTAVVEGKEFIIETGKLAGQAGGSVTVQMGESIMLGTATMNDNARDGADFFPLTVNYEERMYANGTIPGSFFRREGRPGEDATLTCRLIDRPLRPLFPKGFMNEVQVVANVVSSNPEIDADVLALLGTSAALAISGIPFSGPVGAARVGYLDGEYVLNPSASQVAESDLDLVVAGTRNAVLMVESEANCLSEEVMLGSVVFGHEQMQTAIQAIEELAAEVNVETWEWQAPEADESIAQKVNGQGESAITAAYSVANKLERQNKLGEVRDEIVAALVSDAEDSPVEGDVRSAISKLEKSIVRGRIIAGEPRIDGRDTATVRPIIVRTGVLPRTHGSALFTRGETQALVVTTLGTGRDAQLIDAIEGTRKENFMMHYNFPPSSVGETGRVGTPKRREIGHGRLAKRGVQAVCRILTISPMSFAWYRKLLNQMALLPWPVFVAPACH